MTESGQREGMDGEIYVEDRHGNVIDALIRSVRRGTVVQVRELHCLAPARGNAQKRRRLLAERVEAIKARGGTLIELATGLRSPKALPRMLLNAYEQIATSGRARKRASLGRPLKWELTTHDREIIEGIWAVAATRTTTSA